MRRHPQAALEAATRRLMFMNLFLAYNQAPPEAATRRLFCVD